MAQRYYNTFARRPPAPSVPETEIGFNPFRKTSEPKKEVQQTIVEIPKAKWEFFVIKEILHFFLAVVALTLAGIAFYQCKNAAGGGIGRAAVETCTNETIITPCDIPGAVLLCNTTMDVYVCQERWTLFATGQRNTITVEECPFDPFLACTVGSILFCSVNSTEMELGNVYTCNGDTLTYELSASLQGEDGPPGPTGATGATGGTGPVG